LPVWKLEIEIRWTCIDKDTGDSYVHCVEGEILEIIQWSESRPDYPDSRLCKQAASLVAMVDKHSEFNMIDS